MSVINGFISYSTNTIPTLDSMTMSDIRKVRWKPDAHRAKTSIDSLAKKGVVSL